MDGQLPVKEKVEGSSPSAGASVLAEAANTWQFRFPKLLHLEKLDDPKFLKETSTSRALLETLGL